MDISRLYKMSLKIIQDKCSIGLLMRIFLREKIGRDVI